MCGDITVPVDPEIAADRELWYRGKLCSDDLPRIGELLIRNGTTVDFELRFHRDVDNRRVVTGRVGGVLIVECQRCLGSLVIPVDRAISLAVVEEVAEGDHLPTQYEPLLVEHRLVRPIQLLEDELILLVPLVPRHDEGECRVPEPICGERSSDVAEVDRTARHPFAALAEWQGRADR